MLHLCEGIQDMFEEKEFKIAVAVGVNKGLKHINLLYSFHACSNYSELPSYMSTKTQTRGQGEQKKQQRCLKQRL